MILAFLLLQAATPAISAERAERIELIKKLGHCIQTEAFEYVLKAHLEADVAVDAAFGRCSTDDAALQSQLVRAATPAGGSHWTVEQAQFLMEEARRGIRNKVISQIIDAEMGR